MGLSYLAPCTHIPTLSRLTLPTWQELLRGNPVRARQLLRKLIVGPVVMEPQPEIHGYHWRGHLDGGAVFEGTQKYLECRGSGPPIVQNTAPARDRAV